MHSHSKSSRRRFLQASIAGGAGLLAACRDEALRQTSFADNQTKAAEDNWFSTTDVRPLARFPEKDPLILLTDRPPQLETPLRYFREDFTPNEVYFVRWHLAGIPSSISVSDWSMQVTGSVGRPLQLSMDNLRNDFERVSIAALNQCSGNSRGLFTPQVPGGQWRNGAMGNSRWTGARLKDILDKAGVKPNAVEIGLRGLDVPPLSATPVFQKSLSVDHARDGEVMVAYEMNGKPLPMLNGFPVRLVVPGWYATYWVKSLTYITVLDKPLQTFWMDKAYRIPNNPTATESPDHLDEDTIPINKFAVHSIFVSPEPGQIVDAGRRLDVQGLAMDYGTGIRRVEFSSDNGDSWKDATLDGDLGRYSWRRWRTTWQPAKGGVYRFLVRATNNAGEAQLQRQWNHGGYQRSVIEHMDVRVV